MKIWDAFSDDRVNAETIDVIMREGFSKVLVGVKVPNADSLRGQTAIRGPRLISNDPIKDLGLLKEAEQDDYLNVKKLLKLMAETHKKGALIAKCYKDYLR